MSQNTVDLNWVGGFKGLIFDCDGTLVDSLSAHFEAWKVVFKDYNINLPLSFLDAYNSIPSTVIGDDIVSQLKLSVTGVELAEKKEALLFENKSKAKELLPISSVARYFYGKLPMAVISGGVRKNVIKSLEETNLIDLFETVITADEPYPSKDRPEVWCVAAKSLGVVPEKCLVFEDGEKGMIGAKLAGMSVFDVRPILENIDHN